MLRKGRKVTLDELIEACNDALHEINGYGGVSRRTIQHDIWEMRYSQVLGYLEGLRHAIGKCPPEYNGYAQA